MTRALFALLATAWICTAISQPAPTGCGGVPPGGIVDSDHYLEQSRCWFEAQRYGEALLSVERFLALQPADTRALALQDEILRMLGQGAGEGTGPASAPSGDRSKIGGWLALVGGYDSNANSGTDARELSFPLFRDRVIEIEGKYGELRRRPSALVGALAGFDATVPLPWSSQLQFHGFAEGRINIDALDYVPHNYWLQAHADHRAEFLHFDLWLQADQRWINRYRGLDARTAAIAVSAPVWQQYEIGLIGAETLNWMPVFKLRTRERRTGLLLRNPELPIRFIAYYGVERATEGLKTLDRDILGMAAEYSVRLGPGRLDLSAQMNRSDYVEFSQLFLGYRHDRFSELQLSYEYPLTPAWSVTPRFIMQRNRSNLALTDFERVQLLAELRWNF